MGGSLTLLQHGASGVAYVNSGVAHAVLPASCSLGSCVVLGIATNHLGANDVSSVTSGMGTFTKVNSIGGTVGSATVTDMEFWVCRATTGAASSVTVTSSSGSVWSARAEEWFGGVLSAADGGHSSIHNATSPWLVISGLTVGQTLSVMASCSAGSGSVNSQPASPFVNDTTDPFNDFNSGGFVALAACWAPNVAATSETASWNTVFAGDFGVLAVVLIPKSGGFFPLL